MTTCRPLPPEVRTKESSFRPLRRSLSARAASMTRFQASPGAGSRSITRRSACSRSETVEPHTWYLERVHLHEPQEALQAVDVDPALAVGGVVHLVHGRRERVRDVLLEEALARRPVRTAQQHHRPVDEAREDEVGDLAVEVGEILLGDLRVPEQHPLGVRQAYGAFIGRLIAARGGGRRCRRGAPATLRTRRGRRIVRRGRLGRDHRSHVAPGGLQGLDGTVTAARP